MASREDFNLRPMEERDLRTVWTWRNSERVRAVSYTDHEITWEEHLAWYQRCRSDDSSQPMLFERGATPTGVVNFTKIDRREGSSVWGIYVGDVAAPKGTGSIMGVLGLDYAFGDLRLRSVIGESFASNRASTRYHERLGFREIEETRSVVPDGRENLAVVHMKLTAERWHDLRPSIERTVFSRVKP